MIYKIKRIINIVYRFCNNIFRFRDDDTHEQEHDFDARNIHSEISEVSKKLFDNGHYKQATFDAFVLIEERVKEISKIDDKDGKDLMMQAFKEKNPKIALNALSGRTEKNEQEGYRYMFAGSMVGIRNPRAHSSKSRETMDECLDHLSIASALMRKLDDALKNQK